LETTLIPEFRKEFDSKIIKPTFKFLNKEDLKEQYNTFIKSMNLLSYDKI